MRKHTHRVVVAVLVLALLGALLLVSCNVLPSATVYSPRFAVPVKAPPLDAPLDEGAVVSPALRLAEIVIRPKDPKDENVSFRVEIADTPDSRNVGLMNRSSLDPGMGMLFVFDFEATRYFWMKKTLIPLDIIFIGVDGRVADIQTMQPCVAEPCIIHKSRWPAMYALEVNAGDARKHHIELGQEVVLPSLD
jgi:hypothetical protein